MLDTGVDKTHPFLAGKVLSEACFSSTTSISTSVCPGGAASSTATGSGVPCPLIGCDHDTHVAGIAAGKGTSFSGIARDASLVSIQVYSGFSSGCSSAPPDLIWQNEVTGAVGVWLLNGPVVTLQRNLSISQVADTHWKIVGPR